MKRFNDLDLSKYSIETGTQIHSPTPIELHNDDSINRGLSKFNSETARSLGVQIRDTISTAHVLPFAAEAYKISPELSDYVMVPVTIFPTDLPNRNKVAFPYTEVSKFNMEVGMLAYESWKGMPTYVEHVNLDPTIARGIVLDTSLRRIKDTPLWKVNALCAFDRTKDPDLVHEILTGKRQHYSMGALVPTYTCSICGAESEPHKGKVMPCGHRHVNPDNPKFEVFEEKGKKVLAYYNAHDIKGFEVSSVSVPAWASATTPTKRHLKTFDNQ